jgi:LmbE family N-acetylglucosaminyl deacetylase
LGCGGTIARLRAAGHRVQVVYLTNGEASHPGHPALPPYRLAVVRQNEARASANALNIDPASIHFLQLPDGRLSQLTATEKTRGIAELSARLSSIAPSVILAPYRRDGSSEHEAAFALLDSALKNLRPRPRLLEFPIWSWWSPVLLLRSLFDVKYVMRVNIKPNTTAKAAAIACHRSQVEPVAPWTSPVVSPSFVRLFLTPHEYFFEIPPR